VADLQSFRQDVQSLVKKFEQDKNHYLQKGYPEAQLRIDFLNPFFEALGWDLENEDHKPPDKRDVVIEILPANEKRVTSNLRPDYSFRIDGNTKFFVEAKAPSVALDDVNHILQAKDYAWNTQQVSFVILTDFEEFKLFDASLKPNPKYPKEGLLFNFKYTDYLANIERLWELSRERVTAGSGMILSMVSGSMMMQKTGSIPSTGHPRLPDSGRSLRPAVSTRSSAIRRM
jgi:hypothetical protein